MSLPMAKRTVPLERARHWRVLFCALVCLAASSACLGCGMTESGEGPGQRQQPLALTPDQELELGRRAYQEVLSKYSGRILPAGRPEVQRVRQVAARIVRAAG